MNIQATHVSTILYILERKLYEYITVVLFVNGLYYFVSQVKIHVGTIIQHCVILLYYYYIS